MQSLSRMRKCAPDAGLPGPQDESESEREPRAHRFALLRVVRGRSAGPPLAPQRVPLCSQPRGFTGRGH